VLFAVTIFVFSLIRFAPGDPIQVGLGMDYNPEIARQMRHELGLDKPVSNNTLCGLEESCMAIWDAALSPEKRCRI
jgi:peptide/nickel transport system permease protein